MNEAVNRNIVILPTKATEDSPSPFALAIAWSRAVAESFSVQFTLGTTDHLSHLSLYQAAYPQTSLRAVEEKVAEIAAQSHSFEVETRGFSTFWGTYVFWDMKKSPALTELHLRCLQLLHPLREGLLPSQRQLLNDTSIDESLRNNIRQYGHPLCREDERPHITLSRLKDAADAPRAIILLEERGAMSTCRFLVDRIYLADVGPHGTCPGTLQEFRFGL